MAGSTLTSLAGRIVSQEAIIEATKSITAVADFAHRFNEAETARGSVVVVPLFNVPVAKDFNPPTVKYTSAGGTVAGVEIPISDHIFEGFKFTDKDFAQCPVGFWKGGGAAIGRSLGLAIAQKIVGLINKTNVPKSADNEYVLSSITKKTIADLVNRAELADIDASKSTLLLGGAAYSELLSLMDANVYGGAEAVRNGILTPGCYGFGSIRRCNAFSSDVNEKLVAAIVANDAIGYAGSPIEPQGKAGLDEYGIATDSASGLTIGFRRFADQSDGINYMVGECLFGSKLVQPKRVVRLVSAATA